VAGWPPFIASPGCVRSRAWIWPFSSTGSTHRCLRRHGISRLPPGEERASERKRFAETGIGHAHIDVCGLRLAEGKLLVFLAIDHASKLTHVAFSRPMRS
jgi:hypothetical protein